MMNMQDLFQEFFRLVIIINTATGFIGGFTGRFVTESLDAEGIKTT